MAKREYYIKHNFYDLESDDELTILTHFKTHQWTIECSSCPMLWVTDGFDD